MSISHYNEMHTTLTFHR